VQSVSDRATPATWTAEVVPRGGRLPDLEPFYRAVRGVGEPFWLRGIEATVDGELVEGEGGLALRIPGGPVLPLAPLTHKVQWDPRLKRELPATGLEQAAYARLDTQRAGRSGRVRIVGPLVATESGQLPLLEVRQFVWRP
jgi:hypothetical protein